MQQFVPFDDDWAALENLHVDALIPYRVGLLGECAALVQRTTPTSVSIFSSSPTCAPIRCAVPADSSNT